MEEDEKIEIDSAQVVTSAELLSANYQNGHGTNGNGHGKNGHGPTPYEPPSKRTVTVFTTLVVLLIITPFVFTFIGAVTGPLRTSRIPSGRLLFLTGDEPSEHTTTLRGLFLVDPAGNMSLLAHDTEPQDTDSGSRSWIDEPEVAPDGKSVAYLEDQIVLQDEVQSISQQLWIKPLNSGENGPARYIDLSKLGYKRVVGLAWSSDGQKIDLLNDEHLVQIVPGQINANTQTESPTPIQTPICGLPALLADKYVSALSYPTITRSGAFYFVANTPTGPQLIGSVKPISVGDPSTTVKDWALHVPNVVGYGLSADSKEAALVPQGRSHDIRIIDTSTGQTLRVVSAKWGWSVFGGRQITSVGFSPDSQYLLYTVSKPPVPEEEMFLVNLATGDIRLLPYRSGRASWTWVQ